MVFHMIPNIGRGPGKDRKKRKSGLLTKELKRRLPKLYATQGTPFAEKIIVARFVDSKGIWRWYLIEGEECGSEGGAVRGAAEQRGAEQRGAEQRGAEQRGAEQRGAEQRGAEQRGAEEWEFYGMVVGTGVRYEYFKLSELEKVGTVIRDSEWKPRKLKEVVLL